MKLRLKILAMCLGCTLLALVLQTLLFQSTSSEMIYSWSKEENEHSLQNMQNEIYSFLKKMESNLIEVYNEQELIDALKEGQPIRSLRQDFYRKAYEIGTTDFDTADSVVSLYLYTPGHEIISTYRRAMTPKHNYPADLYEEEESINTGGIQSFVESSRTGMMVSSYYNEHRGTDILHLVLKLFDSRNYNKVIGYVVCDVDSKAVRTIMEKYSMDKSVYIWLQPSGDRAALSIGSLSSEEEELYGEISGQIQKGSLEKKDAKGTENQEFFEVRQNKYNLTAYSLMPQELLRQNQKALTANLVLIAVVMIIAAAVLTYILSRNITRPLDRLMDTMEKIKNGNTDLRAEIQKKDEIGMLGQNFNEMLDRVEELAEKEKTSTYLLGQAKYHALQAQINPHFLYNTLDCISWKAMANSQMEIAEMIQCLSKMFRFSLGSGEKEIALAEEIENIKNYLFLQKKRFKDNLVYLIDVPQELSKYHIMKFLLQPLVENSILHGLQPKTEKGYLGISAQVEEGILTLCVWDNGTGINEEQMEQLLRGNTYDNSRKRHRHGVYNVNERLRMRYGEDSALHFENRKKGGTRVTIRIKTESLQELSK